MISEACIQTDASHSGRSTGTEVVAFRLNEQCTANEIITRVPKDCPSSLEQFDRHSPPSEQSVSRPLNIAFLFCLLTNLLSSFANAQPDSQKLPEPLPTTAIGSESEGTLERSSEGSQAAPMIPDYHITRVDFDGYVADDRLWIDATIEILVNIDSGWHSVPLRFDQASILSRTYEGPGEEFPDLSSPSPDGGVTWMVKGKGKHVLKFKMWVPVRQTVLGSQVQITLPPLPKQFVASASIRIPEPNAVVRANVNGTVFDVSRDGQATHVDVTVSNSRLDLAWSVPKNDAETIAQVTTRIHLKPTSDAHILVADQSIDLQQQVKEELHIRLPTDFELLEVSGANFESYTDDPERDGWIVIPLSGSVTGKLELHWILRRPLNADGDRILIDGFEVEGATRQEGLIRVDRTVGYRTIPRTTESEQVYRIGIDQLKGTGAGSLLSAYEFFRQPFRLVQQIVPDLPSYSVTPVFRLSVNRQSTTLQVHQFIQVDRGSADAFNLLWDNFRSDGWEFEAAYCTPDQTGSITPSIDHRAGQVNLTLNRSIEFPSRICLTTVFRKPFPVEKVTTTELTLPQVEGNSSGLSTLLIDNAEDIELKLKSDASLVELNNIEEDVIAGLSQRWILPKSLDRIPATATAIQFDDLSARSMSATVIPHERKVTSSTSVEIVDIRPHELIVHQRIALDVRYGKLDRVELILPKELRDLIPEFAIQESLEIRSGNEFLSVFLSPESLTALLPKPTSGLIEIDVDYGFPVTSADELAEMDLPILGLLDYPYERAECLVTPFESIQVREEAGGWTALRTSPRGPLWVTPGIDGAISSVPLTFGRELADSTQQYIVDELSLFTRFREDGSSETVATMIALSPPVRMVIQFPENTELKSVSVDGDILEPSTYTFRKESPGELTITLPIDLLERRQIQVVYRTPSTTPFGHTSQQRFQFPTFKKSVWVDSTTWEVQLPKGHHLFVYPQVEPEFEWTRDGLFWSRTVRPSFEAERETLLQQVPDEFHFASNYYSFSGFGPEIEVKFRSMNRSLILLIGAGFALLLGFVFYRFPVTRNVFSLVVIGFLFALISVWYPEPLLLLLQPAIFGVVLALTATFIDTRSHQIQKASNSRWGQTSDHALRDSREEEVDVAASTKLYAPAQSDSSHMSQNAE